MLVFVLADTSRKGMFSSSASCWPRSVETTRFSSQSHLLPIRILLTPSVACCSTLANHVRMSVGEAVLNMFGRFEGGKEEGKGGGVSQEKGETHC